MLLTVGAVPRRKKKMQLVILFGLLAVVVFGECPFWLCLFLWKKLKIMVARFLKFSPLIKPDSSAFSNYFSFTFVFPIFGNSWRSDAGLLRMINWNKLRSLPNPYWFYFVSFSFFFLKRIIIQINLTFDTINSRFILGVGGKNW